LGSGKRLLDRKPLQCSPLRFSARKSLRALNSFHQFFVVP